MLHGAMQDLPLSEWNVILLVVGLPAGAGWAAAGLLATFGLAGAGAGDEPEP